MMMYMTEPVVELNKCSCGAQPGIDVEFENTGTDDFTFHIRVFCPSCGKHSGIIVADNVESAQVAEYTQVVASWWNNGAVFEKKQEHSDNG